MHAIKKQPWPVHTQIIFLDSQRVLLNCYLKSLPNTGLRFSINNPVNRMFDVWFPSSSTRPFDFLLRSHFGFLSYSTGPFSFLLRSLDLQLPLCSLNLLCFLDLQLPLRSLGLLASFFARLTFGFPIFDFLCLFEFTNTQKTRSFGR